MTTLFWVLFCSNFSWGQDENGFRFEQITVDEGLAHSDAMAVIQDNDGFVWIGTNNGINRYDGYELKKYDLVNNHQRGLSSNRIRAMHIARSGRMWVGTEHTGLFYYDPYADSFKNVEELATDLSLKPLLALINRTSVRTIVSDHEGRIWIGTQDYCVFVISMNGEGKVTAIERIRLGVSGVTDPDIMSLQADGNGRMWIGTLGSGLWRFDIKNLGQKSKSYRASRVNVFPEQDVRALYEDRNGDFWVGSDTKVYYASKDNFSRIVPVFKELNHSFHGLQCFYMDSAGRLWMGTNFGVVMMPDPGTYLSQPEKNKLQNFLPVDGDEHSINSGRIHQIVEDSFNNLWLAASAGGVNKVHLHPRRFGKIQRRSSGGRTLPNNYVNAIHSDEGNKRLYIGTRNGFSQYDLISKSFQNFLNRAASGNVTGTDVSAFLVTGEKVWIGTRYNGLFRMDRNTGRSPERYSELKGNRSWNYISIESIVADKSERVWVGSNEGLMLFDKNGGYIKTYQIANSDLPSNQITFLLYDKTKDVIWASTVDKGVVQLQEKDGRIVVLNHFKHEPGNSNSLKVNYAWPLLLDKKGDIWIGTIGGGLHRLVYANGKYTMERYQRWLPENDIESILTDDAGNLWIGGAGLFKFSPVTKKYLHYDVSDGLQSNSFKVGSAYRAADGTMYFGGTNGLNYFHPDRIPSNPYAPVVRITRLRVLNRNPSPNDNEIGSSMVTRAFSEEEGVTIRAVENDFSFEFVGLNYVNPEKQKYAYHMEGYSSDWVELPQGQRVASFANLPAGNYTFKVKVNNGEGVWSDSPAEVKVVILPPWYKTWWAYTAYVLLVGAALTWYRRMMLAKLELKNRVEIEKLHAEKEKEIAEVKINFFTNVSHEFRTPLTLILGPMEEFMASMGESGEIRDKVTMMHRQTQKLLSLVNKLLSFRKIESGNASISASRRNVISFVNEIFVIFKVKADERDLEYNMEAPPEAVMLYFDPEKLEVILTNLLSNAFKYTPDGGKIDVSVNWKGDSEMDAVWNAGKLADNYLTIAVQDYGFGIREEELGKIFDPYYQASNTNAETWKGTGIGLALVKQLVQSHSGEVDVKSKIGEGTIFEVKMPFGKAHLSAIDLKEDVVGKRPVLLIPDKEVSAAPVESPVSVRRLKMLIVEDNADLQEYLKSLFENTFEVILSPDGLDGWNRIGNLMPDFVLSDVMMPGMNGLDLCKKIKQNPKTSHIPVILLTARAAAVQELEGLETGADDYIAKPFNPQILRAKVAAILQNRNKLHAYYQRRILLEPTEITIPDEDKIFLENAMRTVEENLTNTDFNVQTLVGMMGMSQSVFYKRVKNMTGQSVIEFIKDIRLKRAAQLLANGNARISEIALMVGIEDPKNFRVSFQKVYNMSPSQYARFHREGVKDNDER
ncbi:hybrid sensor histidine kinase/response regulator transcription factor [Dyadobacter sp. CY312]|uniref:hybrid sensor histidine kinase/response regulator transcription factor n=1 Tax=Dyadobacter sp. CY312 TaxID=2907303 RepID=UPI001F2946D7|nr:hybrid sensor histidine kinase/response regulator transcription factor [Dyadobacter sp. CY312]MCE7043225.1 response regulator [Dyadobacter sp. CY312]